MSPWGKRVHINHVLLFSAYNIILWVCMCRILSFKQHCDICLESTGMGMVKALPICASCSDGLCDMSSGIAGISMVGSSSSGHCSITMSSFLFHFLTSGLFIVICNLICILSITCVILKYNKKISSALESR